MKSLKDLASTIGNFILNQNPAVGVYNATQKAVPIIQQGISNWSQSNPQASRIVSRVEPAYNFGQDWIKNSLAFRYGIPEQTLNQIQSPKLRSLANLGSSIAFAPLNAPVSLLESAYKLPQAKNKREALGAGAQAVNALMMGAVPGAVKNSITNYKFMNPLQKFGSSIVQGAKTGASFGGFSGAMTGIEQGSNLPDPKEYVLNLAKNVGMGVVAGGALGGAVGGVGSVYKQTNEAIQGQARTQAKTVVQGLAKTARAKWPIWAKKIGNDVNQLEEYAYQYYKTQYGQGGYIKPDEFVKKPSTGGEIPKGGARGVVLSVAGEKPLVLKQTPQTPKRVKQSVEPSAVFQISGQRMEAPVQRGQVLSPSQGSSVPTTKQGVPSTDIIPPKVNVKPQELNVNNLNISTAQKEEILSMQANKLKTTLGDKQIMDLASQVGIDTRSHTVDQTAKKIAEQLNLRRNVVSLEGELASLRQSNASQESIISKLKEIDQSSRLSAEQGTDIARQLRARKIMANELDTPMQRIFKLLQNAGVNPDEYTKKAATVDFNNPKQVVSFYRDLVPAKATEWIDQLRYNSMLSSPNTHINNMFSNLGNSGVIAPIEKTITGTLDFLSSPFRGGKRNAFASEGLAYVGGYVGKLHNASMKFADVMSGVSQSKNLDTRYIPVASGGFKGGVAKVLDLPMRLLEASDQFFTTLTSGGEEATLKLRQSKGIDVGDIAGLSKDNATYRLFRSELNDPKQGGLLKGIDHLTGLIMKARNDKSWIGTIAKFTVPFVKTPMNILKQMIEYSPAGVATIPGAMNKTEQLSKAIMGTSAALGAAMLLGSGKTTWAEPTDAKKKAAFRAAGMQPYAIKIGNNWVAYSKLPPALSANLALVSAIHDGIENKRLSNSDADAILSGVSKWGNFFADQSYLKSMGDLLAAVKGDPEKITSYFANYPQQMVPFRALSGWVARILDPYQRKVDTDASVIDKQMQQLMMNIPGLSQQVPARLDQNKIPIENQNRVLNAFSPIRITGEKPQARSEFDQLMQNTRNTQLENDLKKKVERSNGVEQSGNIVAFMGSDGKTHTVDTSFQPTKPTLTGLSELDKKAISKFNGEITSKANDIYDLYKAGKLTEDEANTQLMELKNLKASMSGGKKPAKLTAKKISAKKIKISLPKQSKVQNIKIATLPKLKAQSKSKSIKIAKIKPIKFAKIKGISAGKKLI